MKIPAKIIFSFFVLMVAFSQVQGQEQEPLSEADSARVYVITKNDGAQFVGKIISQDAREVLIETKELGQVYIPRHEIKNIRTAEEGEVQTSGSFVPSEVFSTRYFITTNGLPVEKGETYILWSLYGPDFQFGVGDNLGLGILTTWIGTPLIGSIKYSIPLKGKWNAGLGLLVGTGSWAIPGFALALPYGVITWGDRVKNINLSAGYGGATYRTTDVLYDGRSTSRRESEGSFMVSVAGMVKISKTVSLIFDTFIVPRFGTYETTEYYSNYNTSTGMYEDGYRTVTKDRHSLALILPGLRFQTNPRSAFQFGFAGVRAEGETAPLPIPMVQWFRML